MLAALFASTLLSTGVDVGVTGGVTYLSVRGNAGTAIQLLGAGPLGVPVIFLGTEIRPHIQLEGQVNLMLASDDAIIGATSGGTALILGSQVSYLIDEGDTPYFGGGLAIAGFSGRGRDDGRIAAHVAGGYRMVIDGLWLLRGEGRARFWFEDPGITEVCGMIGVGVVLGGAG